ncbi:MAG TPA: hypothetical protein VNM87_10310, partial [Candidatus Udaeobacter sp.]|nr:hypothetical protein [Candidatus Udaeobacter sp.]
MSRGPNEGSASAAELRPLIVLLLGAAIGIPAALASALLFAGVRELQHWLWTDLPATLGYDAPPWFLIVGLPVMGA